MQESNEGPLAHQANELRDHNTHFQETLRDTMLAIATDPEAALQRLAGCMEELEAVAGEEEAFLRQLGEWGSQQLPQAQQVWECFRIDILIARAQACLLTGRLQEVREAVAAAMPLTANQPQYRPTLRTLQMQVTELES